MYSLLRKLFVIALVVAIAGFALRNYLIKWAAEFETKRRTGFGLTVGAVDFSEVSPPIIRAYDLEFFCPDEMHRKVSSGLVSRLTAHLPPDIGSHPRPRIDRLELEIDRLDIVRAPDGEVNIRLLPALESGAREAASPAGGEPLVGTLVLSVGVMRLVDYEGGTWATEPRVNAQPVSIRGAEFKDVVDANALQRLVLTESFRHVSFPSLNEKLEKLGLPASPPPAPAKTDKN